MNLPVPASLIACAEPHTSRFPLDQPSQITIAGLERETDTNAIRPMDGLKLRRAEYRPDHNQQFGPGPRHSRLSFGISIEARAQHTNLSGISSIVPGRSRFRKRSGATSNPHP